MYCHPKTNCFVVTLFFSVARHARRSQPDRNPPKFRSG